jgi:LacI family transcriptional regulator
MKVIAEEVGLSMMTVSRVLSGNGKVAPATAQKIQEVAERLKYRPNRLVRAMRIGRSGLIGVVLPAGLGSFYALVLGGVHDHFAERDASLLLSQVHGNRGEMAIEDELKVLHRLIELRVDGIILRPANDEATPHYFEEILARGIPMVVIDRYLPNFPCDFVGTDDVAGGEEAASILLARGLKHLLLVTAGDKVATSRDRAAGFRNYLKSSEADVSLDTLVCPTFASNEDLIHAHLSASGKPVDGIFAISDNLGIGCFRALRKLNRRIPEDVALVGFGAVGASDGYAFPFSTFDQHPELIGKSAGELLAKRIANNARKVLPKQTVRLRASFIDRGT